MKDPRLTKLAELIASHSVKLQKGESVLIEAVDVPSFFINALIAAVAKLGAIPIVQVKHMEVLRQMCRMHSEDAFKLWGEFENFTARQVDAHIRVRGGENVFTMSDVPSSNMALFREHVSSRVFKAWDEKNRHVILRYPTPSMAQQAGMSTEAFEDFYFDVCTMDYAGMAAAMQPLKAIMECTDQVRITGKGTELAFSIAGIPVFPCAGEYNIPDGECFTAPVRNSMNGTIHFNVPTIFQGVTFSDVMLTFEDGRIVQATANNTARLNEILDTDDGARFIGEFGIGLNPYIEKPMLDVLFDEKMAGTFHFAIGGAHQKFADNGNRCEFHWDMVYSQTPEFAGGEIWFDDWLIRKDGRFVHRELDGLNHKNLH